MTGESGRERDVCCPGAADRPDDAGSKRARRLFTGAREAVKDAGMVTSEYAMGLVAAVGFAGVLYKVLTSAWARSMLESMVGRALHV